MSGVSKENFWRYARTALGFGAGLAGAAAFMDDERVRWAGALGAAVCAGVAATAARAARVWPAPPPPPAVSPMLVAKVRELGEHRALVVLTEEQERGRRGWADQAAAFFGDTPWVAAARAKKAA
jgi:hypothetical protein